MKPVKTIFILTIAVVLLTQCSPRIKNTAGKPTVYENPENPGLIQGVGIESQDILSMTDIMMRDLLQHPSFMNTAEVRKVIIDAEYFVNESTDRLNKNIITDRLRTGLNRAARGKITFVGREYEDVVFDEQYRKGEENGYHEMTADFRLVGRITSLDAVRPVTNEIMRYHQILFELIDLGNGNIIWSNTYDFKKTAQEDIIYR